MSTRFAGATTEVDYGEVWKVGIEAREVCDEAAEEGHAQERVGTDGEEPQAGDRDRLERSPREGRKSPRAEIDQEVSGEEALNQPPTFGFTPATGWVFFHSSNTFSSSGLNVG